MFLNVLERFCFIYIELLLFLLFLVLHVSRSFPANNLYRPEQILGVLSIAGSCSFLSPFSYQTNLIVAETAGYTIKDFLKLGGPLLLLVGGITVMGATLVWGDGPNSID